MGLAILMIYIPTFLVTSIVSIFIGRLIVKIIRRAKTEETIKTIENKKKIAYIIGTTATVILTISIAWWCTKIDWNGIDFRGDRPWPAGSPGAAGSPRYFGKSAGVELATEPSEMARARSAATMLHRGSAPLNEYPDDDGIASCKMLSSAIC